MHPINIQFTYSAENLQTANILHYKKNYPFRGRVLLWFGILLIWTGVLLFGLKGSQGNQLMIYTFIAYGILVIGIHFYIMKTLGKRIFKKHQNRVAPMDIEITKDDIRFSAGDKTALVKWSEFEKAAISDEVVLLYISKLSFYIFPKENFKDNEFNVFSEFVKERLKVAK